MSNKTPKNIVHTIKQKAPNFTMSPEMPCIRIYFFNGSVYELLNTYKYKDLISTDLTHKQEGSTDKDWEFKFKNVDDWLAVYNKSLESPLIVERLFSGFDTSKDEANVIQFITVVQRQATNEDSSFKDNLIVQSFSLMSLLRHKLWYNNFYHDKLNVDDQGNVIKPDNYMYYKYTNVTDKWGNITDNILTNVLINGLVPNGRKKLIVPDVKLKGLSKVYHLNDGTAAFLPGSYNFEAGEITIHDKMLEISNDFNYGLIIRDNLLQIFIERNKPALFATIDWRYSTQKPTSLTMTHDIHDSTTGVYTTDEALHDIFYSKVQPTMHTTFDAKSDNADNSDTLDQAQDLVKTNIVKIDTVDFEYSELDNEPFTELKLGTYVRYILGELDKIYVITGIQETIEGDDRTINYTLSSADEEIESEIVGTLSNKNK